MAVRLKVESIRFIMALIDKNNAPLALAGGDIPAFLDAIRRAMASSSASRVEHNLWEIERVASASLFKVSGEDCLRGSGRVIYFHRRRLVSLPCYTGWHTAAINVRGDVTLCCLSTRPVGNLTSDDFRKIWFSGRAHRFRLELKYPRRRSRTLSLMCHHCLREKENRITDIRLREFIAAPSRHG